MNKISNLAVIFIGLQFCGLNYADVAPKAIVEQNSESPSQDILCENLKAQLLKEPNHVHTQIRIDTAYDKNCQLKDADFWKSYWPTTVQSDAAKKLQACQSLQPTDAIYIKYHCDAKPNNLTIKDIQTCDRLKNHLQTQSDAKQTALRVKYAKTLNCHLIDPTFWNDKYSP